MMSKKLGWVLLFSFLFFTSISLEGYMGRFVFTQLKYKGSWDPYPSAFSEIAHYLTLTTSVKIFPKRNQIELTSKDLFSYPFLMMAGAREFEPFSKEEIEILRKYLLKGGILFIDDSCGKKTSGFDRAIRRMLKRVFPEEEIKKLPMDHAVFRAFYLVRKVGGRKVVNSYLEGIFCEGRAVAIYSQNDLLGAWARDRLGNWLNECIPGGENQRLEAIKLTLNIIMYSLTGTYKKDKVHEPYIKRKLRR